AQHQRVHKKSDQTLYLLPVPVRVGSPHHDVLLPAVAAQHHLQPRQQCHEQRHPLLPAQPLQPPAQLLTHPDRPPRPRITLHRRTAPLRRQLQLRRRPPQLLPPILELLLQHFPPQPVPLPHRIVGILHRQFRQWRGLLLAIRLIQLHKLPPQHLHRPPIRHDVVHHIQHHLLPRPHLHQLHPQQRPAPQIKRPPRLRRPRSPLSSPPRATTSSRIGLSSPITCTGRPPRSSKRVRSTSCRLTISATTRSNTSTSNSPINRTIPLML